MTLTIDQLRVYLERREREANDDAAREFINQHWASGWREHQESDTSYAVANARHSIYRELLAAIETGELPE